MIILKQPVFRISSWITIKLNFTETTIYNITISSITFYYTAWINKVVAERLQYSVFVILAYVLCPISSLCELRANRSSSVIKSRPILQWLILFSKMFHYLNTTDSMLLTDIVTEFQHLHILFFEKTHTLYYTLTYFKIWSDSFETGCISY